MQIVIRLSGVLAQTAGGARVSVEVPSDATVDQARHALEILRPALGGVLGPALPVVRGHHVAAEHVLQPGDELALLLPAAGGCEGGNPHGC